MTRWASKTTWLRPKDAKTAQKGAKERATSYWECAMSRWASNTTWLHLKGTKTAQKRAKRVRHVVLGPCHVALELQRDVAPPPRRQNSPKGSKKSAPRRIGSPPCRVGPPTRRGSASKAAKLPKSEPKERATSHWPPPCRVGPPTRRGSTSKAPKQPKRGQKECATSYWAPAMSRWSSNATWLRLQGAKTAQKGARRARHVVLALRHVVLDL